MKYIFAYLALLSVFQQIVGTGINSSATKGLKQAEVTVQLKLDISVNNNEYKGSVILGLFGNDLPNATKNFYGLCLGQNSKNLTYVGTKFYRIEEDIQVFAGDVTTNDGKGGESIFGEDFDREEQIVKHDSFAVGMVIKKSKVRSQFYITTQDLDLYPNNGLVVGRVIKGKKFISKISLHGRMGKPSKNITITSCSVHTPKKEDL